MSGLRADAPRRPVVVTRAGWFVVPVVVFVLAGVLLGVLWERLATPGTALVMEGKAYPAVAGVESLFDQTGIFVLLTGGCGLVLGGVLAVLGRAHQDMATLGILVGSLLAAPMAYVVGRALGPGVPDPTGHQDYDELLTQLRLRGIDTDSPLFPFPDSTLLVMAMTALLAVVVLHLIASLSPRAAGDPRPVEYYQHWVGTPANDSSGEGRGWRTDGGPRHDPAG